MQSVRRWHLQSMHWLFHRSWKIYSIIYLRLSWWAVVCKLLKNGNNISNLRASWQWRCLFTGKTRASCSEYWKLYSFPFSTILLAEVATHARPSLQFFLNSHKETMQQIKVMLIFEEKSMRECSRLCFWTTWIISRLFWGKLARATFWRDGGALKTQGEEMEEQFSF